MRDGERSVIADVLAAGLLGVAVEIFLFVTPRRLRRRPEHQDTEDEEDGQPHLRDKETSREATDGEQIRNMGLLQKSELHITLYSESLNNLFNIFKMYKTINVMEGSLRHEVLMIGNHMNVSSVWTPEEVRRRLVQVCVPACMMLE